jgi:hypothetical protein
LPKAPGAPRLRLILSLFDDTPMPVLPNYPAKADAFIDPGFPGRGPGGGPPGR